MARTVHLMNLCRSIESMLRMLTFVVYVEYITKLSRETIAVLGNRIPENSLPLIQESFELADQVLEGTAAITRGGELFARWDQYTDELFVSVEAYYLCLTLMALCGEIGEVSPPYGAANLVYEPLSRMNSALIVPLPGTNAMTMDTDYLADTEDINIKVLLRFQSQLAALTQGQ